MNWKWWTKTTCTRLTGFITSACPVLPNTVNFKCLWCWKEELQAPSCEQTKRLNNPNAVLHKSIYVETKYLRLSSACGLLTAVKNVAWRFPDVRQNHVVLAKPLPVKQESQVKRFSNAPETVLKTVTTTSNDWFLKVCLKSVANDAKSVPRQIWSLTSAVWRAPPRAGRVHLPLDTETEMHWISSS